LSERRIWGTLKVVKMSIRWYASSSAILVSSDLRRIHFVKWLWYRIWICISHLDCSIYQWDQFENERSFHCVV
jgi:hypothetical protein